MNPTAQESTPNQIWLEMQTPDKQPVLGMRWGNLLGYPAPAWGMSVTQSQVQSRVQAWVRATYLDRQPVQRTDQPLATFFNNYGKVLVQGVEARIESVTVEEFPRVDPQGERDKDATYWCVVVRLNYPKGHPVFVQPDPAVDPEDGGGYEHHFYSVAGSDRDKYTGIFWFGSPRGNPWDRKEIESRVKGIILYSVDALKQDQRQTTQDLIYPLGAPLEVFRDPTPRFLRLLFPSKR